MATDYEARIADLETELDVLKGAQAGMMTVLTSLIAKHPDHEQLLLVMASMLEILESRSRLSPVAQAIARSVVEELQRTRPVQADIRPLG
jgi:cytochrome P450